MKQKEEQNLKKKMSGKDKVAKTNAARILDSLNITYEILTYEVDGSALDAISVANKLKQNIDQIYKTIVCKTANSFIVACIAGDLKLNLKYLASVAKVKSCELIDLRDLEKITGYIRGGCSPIGMKKEFMTFIDDRVLSQDFVFISAGIRGKQLRIKTEDLIKACKANVCKLS